MKSSRSATASHAEREGILAVLTEQSTIGISPADAWVRDGMSRAEADVLATEIIAGAEAVATSPGIRTALQFDPAIIAGRSIFSKCRIAADPVDLGPRAGNPVLNPEDTAFIDRAVFELLAC